MARTYYRAAKQGPRNYTAVGPHFDDFWAAVLWANSRGYEAVKEFRAGYKKDRLVETHCYDEETVASSKRSAEVWIGNELEAGRDPSRRIDWIQGRLSTRVDRVPRCT